MKSLDTNIFIRALVADDAAKAASCRRLLRALERGEDEATVTEAALAEVLYVLTSPRLYAIPREEIRDRLHPLLQASGLRLPNRAIYLRALDLFALHQFLDFPDALHAAYVEDSEDEIVSYDTDFDRVPGITRTEP